MQIISCRTRLCQFVLCTSDLCPEAQAPLPRRGFPRDMGMIRTSGCDSLKRAFIPACKEAHIHFNSTLAG